MQILENTSEETRILANIIVSYGSICNYVVYRINLIHDLNLQEDLEYPEVY